MNLIGSGLTVLSASAAVLAFTGNLVPDSRAMQKREEELSARTQPRTRTETEELSYLRINRLIERLALVAQSLASPLPFLVYECETEISHDPTLALGACSR